jgi:hypothetical protein
MKRKKRCRQYFAVEVLGGLEDLVDKLESGVPIEAVQIRRVMTPDGPMHLRRHVVIEPGSRGADQGNEPA